MISGVMQLWLFERSEIPAPTTLADVPIHPIDQHNETHQHEHKHQHSHADTEAKTWFQGHIFAVNGPTRQYALLGVPAQNPPHIHGCMVSDHDTPMYYDVYVSEYIGDSNYKVVFCAMNVERNGGSGDAVELNMENSSAMAPSNTAVHSTAQAIKTLRLSTSKMLTGNQARQHLTKYAPDALAKYDAVGATSNNKNKDIVVCMGGVAMFF
ncbi:hypothetical protein LPJ66_004148 [Kickxella alabastrina]|uniref:Uncharacterized protein n=1 Tax=Kickxella alabastrina TaxID=61397 RepID=A0ACC1IKF6_9FUNG|nr:hypothetical protein LPJ66_004148 [Kickxella alabastrina]